MTFEQVWEFTDSISYETAYHRDEAEELFNRAMEVDERGLIVEIGCQHGRSSSILAQVAKARDMQIDFIDPFEDTSTAASWIATMRNIGTPVTLHMMRTEQAMSALDGVPISLLHIDGDHSREGIIVDCQLLPMMKVGGIVLAHDYGQAILPDVKPTMDEMAAKYGLVSVKVVRTLAAWRAK